MTLSNGQLAAAREVLERVQPSIQGRYMGQFIAIDPVSKDYFIDTRLAGALRKAMAQYPDREFYTTKIGASSVITFSHAFI